ncbi:MAG: peptidyl-prolyl cis-trans isomerase [Candidatus Eisenbacteria bacterium]
MPRRAMPRTLLALIATALLLLSCGGKKESVVAKVGDQRITLGDFNLAYKAITIFNRPPLVTYEDAESFLNTLINKNLMVRDAIARGHDKNETLLREMEQWRREQSIRALFKDVAESDIEITLAEVEDYYRRSRVTVKARQILVPTLAEAEEIARELSGGADFTNLARSRSKDVLTAPLGGDMGIIRRGLLDPPLERAIFALSAGAVSEPVQTARGYHIARVDSIMEPSMDDFEEQRHTCAAELRSRRRNENWNTYLDNVKAALAIEKNEENMAWLNDRLPERGSMDNTWAKTVSDEDRGRVLISHAGGNVTVADFVEEYGSREGVQPYTTEGAELIRSVLEAEIINKTNADEAKSRGLDQSDDVVRAVEKNKEERLVDLLFGDLVKDVQVPEDRIREEYENQKENLIMPVRAKIQVIQVLDRSAADKIVSRLSSGASFDSLAREYNTGRLKEIAGVLDLMPRQNVPTELQSYAFDRLRVGEVTPVVSAMQGFYVAKLLEKDAEHPMLPDEAKPMIEKALLEGERDKALLEWLEAKREETGVTVYPEVLNLLIEAEETEGGS